MKITKLRITDFLGVSAFSIDKPGKLNVIKGENGLGKSAILKAITEAFISSGQDPHIIRNGSDCAEIMIELDHRILIERKITAKKNDMKVLDDGAKVPAPVSFLKALIGEFTFNPVDFFLGDKKKRREILLSAIPMRIDEGALREALGDLDIPIDLTKFDYDRHGLEVLGEIKKHTFNVRHEQGVVVTRIEKSIEQDKRDLPEGMDPERFDGFDFTAKFAALEAARQQISDHDKQLSDLESMRNRSAELADEIELAERRLAELKKSRETLKQKGVELKAKVESFERPDVESMAAEINEFQAAQKLVHKVEAIREKETTLEKESAIHAALDTFHKAVVGDVPKYFLARSEMPVEGLEIGDDEIFVGGVDLNKLSTSEQISFAVKVARATSGQLKVICVDRWESLDQKAQSVFAKEAEQDDFEYFVTQVDVGELRMERYGSAEDGEAETAPAGKAGF